MHEMALMQGVFQLLEEQGLARGFSRIRTIRLEIGRLATVEPEALRFCFDAIQPGSIADGAVLEIMDAPGTAFCFDCGEAVEIMQRFDDCPRCGGGKLQVTGGDEMLLRELEVE
jgi:hydrogenase nickel incorporation protein HypA/HybF